MKKIEIPTNATNGEVMELLFPSYVYSYGITYIQIYVDEKHHKKNNYLVRYSKKWWDRPYNQKEE